MTSAIWYSIPRLDSLSLAGGAHNFLRGTTTRDTRACPISSSTLLFLCLPKPAAINEGCISYYFSRVEKRLHTMVFFALFPAENEHADFHSHESLLVRSLARSNGGSIQQKAAESRTENDKVRVWSCTRALALNENACKWAPCSLIKNEIACLGGRRPTCTLGLCVENCTTFESTYWTEKAFNFIEVLCGIV